ncbi:MAG TPA: 4Fe-4S dicluster domain-containing protein, partial [Candidatus Obscuribacter sp.]|nr:4Fe-4S dicluster domain-containing protein [Candidatus Obscuribacter sp.]
MKEASDCKLEGACDGPINLFNLQVAPDLLSACIHCGLCLPACPTYLATGHESQSPRGRIYAVMKSQGGQVERALDHLSTCLGCLGCQTACPSGVQYESILEQVRPALAARRSWPARTAMRLFFRLLGNYGLLRLLFIPVRFVQRLSLDRLPEVLVRLCPFLKGTWLGRLASWRQFTP